MKKVFVGAFASLMLAGVITAVSGAPNNTTPGVIVIVGEGSAPIPLAPVTEITTSDEPSLEK
jgi:hypothetical protein